MKNSLFYTHPNLFKTLMNVVFVNLTIGVLLIVDTPEHLINFTTLPKEGIIPPLAFWGVCFIISGLLVLSGGLFRKYYRITRMGLVACAALGGFWAFGFTVQYFTGGIRGISAPVLWAFYTLICMTVSREPGANPLSIALQNDIHTTLQTAKHRDHVLNKDHPKPSVATMESKQNGDN